MHVFELTASEHAIWSQKLQYDSDSGLIVRVPCHASSTVFSWGWGSGFAKWCPCWKHVYWKRSVKGSAVTLAPTWAVHCGTGEKRQGFQLQTFISCLRLPQPDTSLRSMASRGRCWGGQMQWAFPLRSHAVRTGGWKLKLWHGGMHWCTLQDIGSYFFSLHRKFPLLKDRQSSGARPTRQVQSVAGLWEVLCENEVYMNWGWSELRVLVSMLVLSLSLAPSLFFWICEVLG